jgi:hypothetical protein
LTRYDLTKPHAPGNTFWLSSNLPPQELAALKKVRKKARQQFREERVARDKILQKIRNAESFKQRNQYMATARKAGHTFAVIGTAARVTPQRVQMLLAAQRRKRDFARR